MKRQDLLASFRTVSPCSSWKSLLIRSVVAKYMVQDERRAPDMSGCAYQKAYLAWIFGRHSASLGQTILMGSYIRSVEWSVNEGVPVEIVSAVRRLFPQFFLRRRILVIPQSGEGRLKVVGNGTLLLCRLVHEPTLELRRNTKIQRVTLYHLEVFFLVYWRC